MTSAAKVSIFLEHSSAVVTSETSEMCRSGMCLATTAYILLMFSLVACALCFVAPFWIHYNDLNTNFIQQIVQKIGQFFTEGGHPLKSAGLWGRCNADNKCFGFWENDYSWEKNLPGINVSVGSTVAYYSDLWDEFSNP